MRSELIEASAGTGKTHALVERMVAALREGAEPREIVALTFSRAAAGEIFARFVERLASDPSDAPLLRRVVETQHLSLIGTLDAFLMRFVQMFPLELGLTGDVSVLEGFSRTARVGEVALAVLRSRDPSEARAVAAAFRLAVNGEAARAYLPAYAQFVERWHRLFLDHPAPAAWGEAARIWPDAAAAPAELAARTADVRALAPALAEHPGRGVATFAAAVAAFDGSIPKLPKALEGEPTAARAVKLMRGWRLARRLETARGLHALLAAFERAYERRVRARGRLAFDDVPRLIARLAPDVRLALEYRLDARIRHWALDEFQDTSHEQWGALANLVDEAVQSADADRSAFIVGDRKQAIYGWRNGDVAIFAGERASGRYALGELNESWRYTQEIAEAVNRVFASRALARFGKWVCPEHVAHDRARRGFVHLVTAAAGRMEDFVSPLVNELSATRPWERGRTCAVLVRGNAFGAYLGAELRRAGVPCVWEGESAVLDTPVLRAFTALVRLAEHPADALAYAHLRATPLAAALFPDGLPEPEEVSRRMLAALTARGLVRTFQEARARLPADAWDAFTEHRFAEMLRAAAAFEAALEPGTPLTAFEAYLEAQRRRGGADAARVRIMTIHRSKGLGFDYVLLPLYEPVGLDRAVDAPLVGPRGDWVLPSPGEGVAEAYPALAAPYAELKDASVYEGLCVYYVAMTRAKTALTLILPPPPKGAAKTTRFSDFVRESGLTDLGEAAWYETPPTCSVREAQALRPPSPPAPPPRRPRARIARRTPSLSFRSGMSAASLFEAADARAVARRLGTEAHAVWETVDWLSDASARTPLARALVRPANLVELWRERAYELFADGAWESGQFDRVVFTRGADGALDATVYDFKTNALRPGETRTAFAARLRAAYLGQMAAYRRAVSVLAFLPLCRVRAVLLLTATSDAVEV